MPQAISSPRRFQSWSRKASLMRSAHSFIASGSLLFPNASARLSPYPPSPVPGTFISSSPPPPPALPASPMSSRLEDNWFSSSKDNTDKAFFRSFAESAASSIPSDASPPDAPISSRPVETSPMPVNSFTIPPCDPPPSYPVRTYIKSLNASAARCSTANNAFIA